VGAAIGLLWPSAAGPAELAVQPILALLLYATFLGIPMRRVGRGLRDWRFMSTVLVLNFIVVPLVVWPLSRIVAYDQAVLVGVLMVLLTPCIDYVIVFAGLAGGDAERLFTAAPMLMLGQMLLLPAYLWLFVGPGFAEHIELRPFVDAFVFIIALPLVTAALTQFAAARWRAGRMLDAAGKSAMVPLMVATLVVVVASQISGVGARLSSLVTVLPLFVIFAGVMVPIGMLVSRVAGLETSGRRAVVFSGATRNSLVVLPLVLALPAAFDLSPLVVVTQTLVELVAMVVLIRLVPRLLPESKSGSAMREHR
jgi:ACR3 family arsenite efflux pump ArsB